MPRRSASIASNCRLTSLSSSPGSGTSAPDLSVASLRIARTCGCKSSGPATTSPGSARTSVVVAVVLSARTTVVVAVVLSARTRVVVAVVLGCVSSGGGRTICGVDITWHLGCVGGRLCRTLPRYDGDGEGPYHRLAAGLHGHRGRQSEETRFYGPDGYRSEDRHATRRLDGRERRTVTDHLQAIEGAEHQTNGVESRRLRDEGIVDLVVMTDLGAVMDRESKLHG